MFVIACAEEGEEDEYIAEHPVLIVEVLSQGTERTDRNEKMQEYKSLPSLREYVLIAQERVRVEVYSHDRAGAAWRKNVYTDLQSEIAFASIGVTIKLAEIYRRVKFPAQNEQEEGELQ